MLNNNCLVTKKGRIVDCTGVQHEEICKRMLKVNLQTFLCTNGGVRVKVGWPNTEVIAIEFHHKPTNAQMRFIRGVLREADYYTVVLNFKTINRFRPIRGFEP